MDYLQLSPLTQNLTASVLAAGSTSTISQSSAATYAIAGKLFKQNAAWSNQATPTTDYATGGAFAVIPPGYGAAFIIGIDSSGNMQVIGPSVPTNGSAAPTASQIQALDASNNFIEAPQFAAAGPGPSGSPPTYNNFCPLGYVVIKNALSNGSNWTFGTTSFGATGITKTFVDVNTLPGRPQVS